jgi:predicted short-subunit dehydrogenase-like oxidoreductase (DUF2520 family)
MRELERESLPLPTPLTAAPLAVIGRGRVGRSLARAAELAGIEVRLGGGDEPTRACRGAMTLDPLDAVAKHGGSTFSLHPLQTFADGETAVGGTPAAIAGSDDEALEFARGLAGALGMKPFAVPEEDRAAYHAAAAIASNLLVALEESAAELLERTGIEQARELLAPLVLRTAANWAERGPVALTGPIARGDHETVERHRDAIAETAPELLPVYDALAARATVVARASEGVSA